MKVVCHSGLWALVIVGSSPDRFGQTREQVGQRRACVLGRASGVASRLARGVGWPSVRPGSLCGKQTGQPVQKTDTFQVVGSRDHGKSSAVVSVHDGRRWLDQLAAGQRRRQPAVRFGGWDSVMCLGVCPVAAEDDRNRQS